jgi:hypothetical protein
MESWAFMKEGFVDLHENALDNPLGVDCDSSHTICDHHAYFSGAFCCCWRWNLKPEIVCTISSMTPFLQTGRVCTFYANNDEKLGQDPNRCLCPQRWWYAI